MFRHLRLGVVADGEPSLACDSRLPLFPTFSKTLVGVGGFAQPGIAHHDSRLPAKELVAQKSEVQVCWLHSMQQTCFLATAVATTPVRFSFQNGLWKDCCSC